MSEKLLFINNTHFIKLQLAMLPFYFSLKDKIQAIFEATFTHSKNLASFVFIYKSLTNIMEYLQTEKSQFHSFVAAFFGGYLIWGNYNKVNEQVRF